LQHKSSDLPESVTTFQTLKYPASHFAVFTGTTN